MPSSARYAGRIASLAIATIVLAASAFGKPAALRFWSPDVKGPMLGMNQVFNGMGCAGKNVSPELRWSGAPPATKSFAVTVYDPDAPTGSGWWHWVVYDIPATAAGLPPDAGSGRGLPAGAAQGVTDFGTAGFGGACPPKGDKPHRYIFTLYALKIPKLSVPATASPAMIGFNLHANTIAKSTFLARYGR